MIIDFEKGLLLVEIILFDSGFVFVIIGSRDFNCKVYVVFRMGGIVWVYDGFKFVFWYLSSILRVKSRFVFI